MDNSIGLFSQQNRMFRKYRLDLKNSVMARVQEARNHLKVYSAPSVNIWKKIQRVGN